MGMSASQARLMSMTSRLSDLELRAQTISNAKVRLADQSEGASRAYSDALDKQTMKVYSGLQADGTSSYVDANLKNITSYSSTANLDSTNSKFRYIETGSGSLVATKELLQKAGLTVTNGVVSGSVGTKDQFLANFGIAKDMVKYPATNGYDQDAQSYKYYSDLYDKISNHDYTLIQDTQANSPEWLQSQIDSGNIFLREYDKEAGVDGKGAFQDVSWTSGDSSLQEKTDKTDTARAEADYESAMASIKSKEERFDLQLKEIDTEHTAVQTEMDSVKKVMSKNIERTFKIFDA